MDFDYLMIGVFVIGVLTLFFFPEPESNFLWYGLTALGFVLIELGLWFFRKRFGKG